jgi:hypothetical protein
MNVEKQNVTAVTNKRIGIFFLSVITGFRDQQLKGWQVLYSTFRTSNDEFSLALINGLSLSRTVAFSSIEVQINPHNDVVHKTNSANHIINILIGRMLELSISIASKVE